MKIKILASECSSDFRDANARGLITLTGRFVSHPLGRERATFHAKRRRELHGGKPIAFPRDGKAQKKGPQRITQRVAAPICGKEPGVMANWITGRAKKERAARRKNARNCWFSYCDPVARRFHAERAKPREKERNIAITIRGKSVKRFSPQTPRARDVRGPWHDEI